VGIDFYPDAEPASLGEYRGYPTVPTLSSGIARIEKQIGDLLERLNGLPLDATVANLNDTLEQAAAALDAVRRLAGSDSTQALPGQLDRTLQELRRTIESFSSDSELYSNLERTTSELNRTLQRVQDLAQKLEDQPNSIIFSSKTKPDPEPRATP
jgi:paraquat-inducible protein B